MKFSINAVHTSADILICITIQDIQATPQDNHLQQLKEYIIQGWPASRNEIPQVVRPYWTFWDDLTVIDRILMKSRCIIIHEELQRKALELLYFPHSSVPQPEINLEK